MTYSAEQLKAMCPAQISECSQKHVQSVIAELIETAQAQPASVPALDKQAAFEAWLENYPIQIVGDDYELCSDAFDAGVLAASPQAPQPAQSVPMKGTPMRAEYVKVARVFALAYGLHDDAPTYLPRTPEESDAFEPHSWVIGAMMQAFGDGWDDGHAAGMAVMKEAAKRQLKLNDPSVQKRLAAQWGYVQGPATAPAEPAAPQPEAQPQWRPIETAPKDARKMLLTYTNSNGMRRIVVGGWVTDEEAAETDTDDVGLEAGWYERIDNWDDYSQVSIHQGEPTHWMPLPAAPSAQAEPTACPHTGQCHPGFCPCSDAKQAEQKGGEL